MIARLPGHIAGTASAAATGTVQRASRVAPHQTIAAAIGSRSQSGMGRAGHGGGVPAESSSIVTQPTHSAGTSTNVTATIAAVAPSAMPSWRHSRRATNHSSPMPGRDLGQQHERPRRRVAEADHDRDREQQVNVAVIELDRDRRESKQDEDRATTKEGERGEKHRVPACYEDDPRQRGEGGEDQRDRPASTGRSPGRRRRRRTDWRG